MWTSQRPAVDSSDWLDRGAIPQRCSPSSKDPTNTPNQAEDECIQEDIRGNARADDDVSTALVFMTIGRHKPYSARPQKSTAAAGDVLLKSMPREEEQWRNDAEQRSD
jgi:hypothetical protein